MISNYEIRENSITPNSVFILLIKADEQGHDDVLRELSDFCKEIDTELDGFDYIFELTGINDEYMLEKIRGRLEFISSSVMGISQTFGNRNKTETINIEKTMTLGSSKINKAKYNTHAKPEVEGTYTKKSKEKTVNLSDSGFSVTNEAKTEVNFRDIKADSSLVSGDEKEIEILGDTSLKIMQTIPSITRENSSHNFTREEIPQEEVFPQEKQFPQRERQPLGNTVETKKQTAMEENKPTVKEYSSKEKQNVSMSVEQEKTGLLGTLFSKIKSAINPKENNREIKNKTVPTQEKSALSELLRTKTDTGHKKQQTTNNLQSDENPFQDLGSGIIVKKGVLSEEENITSATRQELSANPVTAQLQVDDIFAAETVCDLYDNESGDQKQGGGYSPDRDASPLDRLENAKPSQKEEIDESLFGEKAVSKTSLTQETKKDNHEELFANIDKKENETVTLPDKIFTKGDVKREQAVISSPKEATVIPNKVVQSGQPLHNLEKENKESQNSLPEQKTKPVTEVKEVREESVGYSLPSLPGLDAIKKEPSPTKRDIQEEGTIKTNPETKQEMKMQQISKPQEEVRTERKPEPEIRNIQQVPPLVKKEEQSMQDPNRTKHTIQKQNLKTTHRVGATTSSGKTRAKIDHTLHVATPTKDAKYRNYPIEMPLIPTYTFANMDISAIRFAHAMAMATLDDLGKSSNPFLLQGPSGTGKTHFLHAIGYEVSKKIPQAKILFTNGVRFSRGVQYLLEKGQKAKLDEFFNNAEVLIIDDVHLTAVNEHNREYISKVLNDFLKNKKQIILSSKYPPESLKRFEELVNFKFSLGTIAELKVPSKAHFTRLTNKIVSSSFLDLTEQQVQSFFSDQSNSLGDVARNVKRVKVLYRRIESSGIKKMSYEEILKEMTAFNGENNESEIVKKDFADITALERNKEDSWGNFGFFFPASNIDKFRWVAFAFQEAAKELGIKGGFNYALKSAYSTEHIISAAFKIANICDLKGLKGAIILGPAFVECKEPIRDNFYDILTHMLEVMMIRCGTINFEDIKKPSAYIKMLGDILK